MLQTQPMSSGVNAFCTNCGAPLEAGLAFCTSCGAHVAQEVGAPAGAADPSLSSCAVCGKPLIPGNAFCIHCGAEVKRADGSPQQGPEPAPVPKEKPQPKPIPEPVAVPPSPFSPAPAPTPAATVLVPPTPVASCAYCGRPLVPGNTFCIHCGKEVVGKGGHEPYADPVSEPIDDDDPLVISTMIEITSDEARRGCRKTVVTDEGLTVQVDVPPNAHAGTKVDVPGHGLRNPHTGERGPLRVSFYIVPAS